MKKMTFNFVVLSMSLIAFAGLPGALSAAEGRHAFVDKESEQSGKNALVEEMLILDNTFREVVSGVALGDGERVRKALGSMHGTMEKTLEGVHEGTVKIPKNAGRVKEFVKMDERLHTELEQLAQAAEENNTIKMEALTKKILDDCVSCHRTFRK